MKLYVLRLFRTFLFWLLNVKLFQKEKVNSQHNAFAFKKGRSIIDSFDFTLCFHNLSLDQWRSELQLNADRVLLKQFV